MSGHNRWSKIKRAKSQIDLKRGKNFTKLLREIELATHAGGDDPKLNARLREALAEARTHNMPGDNIQRAIDRGLGKSEAKSEQFALYEAFLGPAGGAVLIECYTDNRNRTVANLRALLARNHGTLGEGKSVGWNFLKKGLIEVAKTDASEEQLIEFGLEVGFEDIQEKGAVWEIYVPTDQIEKVKAALEMQGIHPEKNILTYVPQNLIKIKKEHAREIMQGLKALENLEDVQKVYSNFEFVE